MTHCRYDRRMAFIDCPGHCFFIESPKFFQRTAASAHDHHIHTRLIQPAYGRGHRCRSPFSLDLGRTQDQLDPRIPASGNIDDILDSRPAGGSNDADPPGISGNGLFMGLVKITFLLQKPFKLFIFPVKLPFADPLDLSGVKLISSIPLIDTNITVDDHLHAFTHGKSQSPSGTGKHDASNGALMIF